MANAEWRDGETLLQAAERIAETVGHNPNILYPLNEQWVDEGATGHALDVCVWGDTYHGDREWLAGPSRGTDRGAWVPGYPNYYYPGDEVTHAGSRWVNQALNNGDQNWEPGQFPSENFGVQYPGQPEKLWVNITGLSYPANPQWSFLTSWTPQNEMLICAFVPDGPNGLITPHDGNHHFPIGTERVTVTRLEGTLKTNGAAPFVVTLRYESAPDESLGLIVDQGTLIASGDKVGSITTNGVVEPSQFLRCDVQSCHANAAYGVIAIYGTIG